MHQPTPTNKANREIFSTFLIQLVMMSSKSTTYWNWSLHLLLFLHPGFWFCTLRPQNWTILLLVLSTKSASSGASFSVPLNLLVGQSIFGHILLIADCEIGVLNCCGSCTQYSIKAQWLYLGAFKSRLGYLTAVTLNDMAKRIKSTSYRHSTHFQKTKQYCCS